MKRWLCLALFAGFAVFASAMDSEWHRTGPTAGSISKLVPDRSHPGVWYAIEQSNRSLYRSVDNGESWIYTRLSGVGSIVVHSGSSEVFVVRDGRDSKHDLLSSVDFGRTFKLRSANAPRYIFDHPTEARVLWGSGTWQSFYDLSVSTDRGAHWTEVTNMPYQRGKQYEIDGMKVAPDDYFLSSILVSPIDPNTIYVSTEVEFPISCSGSYIDLELVSTNFGRTWRFTETPASTYIYDPAFPDRAFSVSYSEARLLTRNGWKTLASRHFFDIVSVPGNPDKLYALYEGRQWVSRDGGSSWSRVFLGPGGHASILSARLSPEGSFLAGTSGGGLYVIDSTQNWKQVVNGVREANVGGVATSPGGRSIFAITWDNETFIYRSLNSSATWKNMTDIVPHFSGYGLAKIFVNQLNPQHVLILNRERAAVSFNGGDKWAELKEKPVQGIFFSPDFKIVYISKQSSNHLLKSMDGGITTQSLPAVFGSAHNTIRDLAVDPFSGYLYAGTQEGLFLSKDEGRTAQQIATNLSPDCLRCLDFTQVIALPKRGQYLASANGGLFKTMNQGVTWQYLSTAVGILYVADNEGNHLFLLDRQFLESTDGGNTWIPISASVDPALAPNSDEYFYAMSDPRRRPWYLATSIGMFRADN